MRKITSLFLFLILMLNFLIFIPTGESSVISLVDWDEGPVGATSGTFDSMMLTNTIRTDIDIDNSYIFSSPFQLLHYTGDSDADNEGYINLTTDYDYMNSITFYLKISVDVGNPINADQLNYFYFLNNSGELFHFKTRAFTDSYTRIYLIGDSGEQLLFNFISGVNYKMVITHVSSNLLNFSLYNVTGGDLVAYIEDGTLQASTWTSFNSIKFIGDSYNTPNGESVSTYIDDIIINIADETVEEGTIHLNLIDLETGEALYAGGLGTGKAWMLESSKIPNVRLDIRSDLLGGFSYNPTEEYGTTITISGLTFVNGDYHFINLSFMSGFKNQEFESKHYFDSDNYLQLFDGQTFIIFISDSVTGYGGFGNCGSEWGMPFDTEEFGDPGWRSLCTDKEWYTQGESINIRYVAPDPQWLLGWGAPTGNYFVWIYDVNNLGLWVWETDGGQSADNGDYLDTFAVSLDNTYHYLHWDYDSGETFGYKTVDGGIDEYKMFIGHRGGGFFNTDYTLTQGPSFFIETGAYTPLGNITSISPTEPKLGQFVNISFEANNNGYLTVRNILAPGETEQVITNFQRFEGIEHVNWQFFEFGSYELNLYVSSGIEFTVVDTATFDITDINGSFGDFGFGIEFLTVEPERVIAGFDVVFINYRSLDDTGEIKVIDARGQTTSYGTVIGQKRGVLNITVPNHASIGEWNVTLTTANNTLYSSFQVIAEENNWVEFYSNVFLENDQFRLKLKHDKKIELVFSKDGQEIGTDWYLDSGILPGGIYPVPLTTVTLSPGNWKVEMWQVNNFVKIKKLAEDTCVVIEVPAGTLTEGGNQNVFQMLTAWGSIFADGEFGLAFMAIIFIIVVIIALAQYKIKNDTIFFGGILMALFMAYIGWLPVWIVVLAIVIAGILFSNAFSKKIGIGS